LDSTFAPIRIGDFRGNMFANRPVEVNYRRIDGANCLRTCGDNQSQHMVKITLQRCFRYRALYDAVVVNFLAHLVLIQYASFALIASESHNGPGSFPIRITLADRVNDPRLPFSPSKPFFKSLSFLALVIWH